MSTRKIVHTYVPGKGATECYAAVQPEQAGDGHYYHEETAYTVAHGASLAGTPAFVYLKSHGAAKAMNSIVASLHSGTGAPLVVFVFEDKLGSSSDHPFVSHGMLRGIGAEILASGGNALSKAAERAFHASHRGRKPVFVSVHVEELATPGFLDGFREKLESLSQDLLDHPQPVDDYRALLNPLLSGRFLGQNPPVPECPAGLPPRLRAVAESYEPAMKTLKSLGYDWVTGDAGTTSLFGLPPLHLVNINTHMGSALPLALGASLAGAGRVLAIVGDFSFFSTAALALTEMVRRRAPVDVVIFANGTAAATGGQRVELADVRRQIVAGCELVEGGPEGLEAALRAPAKSPRVYLLTSPAFSG